MSKHLDEEYKRMIASEVPDLWDRIEASLPEKNVVKSEPAEETTTLNQENAETGNTDEMKNTGIQPENTKKKKPVIFKILPWAGAITVAALVLIVALPAILLSNLGKKAAKNETAMPMAAAYDSYEATEETGAMAETAEEMEYYNGVDNLTGSVNFAAETREKGGRTLDFDFGTDDQSFKEEAAAGEASAETEEDADLTSPSAQDESGAVQSKTYIQQGASQKEQNIYARIGNITQIGDIVYCDCELSTELTDFTEPDEDLRIEMYRIQISDDSDLEAETGEIYRVEFDDYEMILLEKME